MRYGVLGALAVVCALATAQTPSANLLVTGDITKPLTLTAADLAQMPRDSVTLDEDDGSKTVYEGVALQEVLKKAGILFGRPMRGKALAGYVLAKASDGYAVVFSFLENSIRVSAPRM
jgi:DMSO/TMAO reductase YedYZ molybdopterin-dependent catalytic subunit